MSEFLQIRDYLSDPSQTLDNYTFKTNDICIRFSSVLKQPDVFEKGDFLGLLQQFLVHFCDEYPEQKNITVSNRIFQNWEVITEDLENYFLECIENVENTTVYLPDEIKNCDISWSELKSVYCLKELRLPIPRPIADWYIRKHFGFEAYSSETQKNACRVIATMKPGLTALVVMSTGEGKSLLFQLAAKLNAQDKLVIVVMPTTSLAIDQERRMQELLEYEGPLAYYSGNSANNTVIYRALWSNSQPVLFVSPEALLRGLAKPVLNLAKKGLISHLFIDEAHIINTWGEGFRTDFQLLSGFWRKLREVASTEEERISTVLMTATLTDESEAVLDSLFQSDIKIKSIRMRSEPYFYRKYFYEKIENKKEYLLQLMYTSPKPAIIYCTSPETAEQLFKDISNHLKITRIDLFTGNTNAEERQRVLKKWVQNEIDFVVGTSAFGLGIDKGNVRTVIHYELPESIDRYYQEVGRAGRDGNGCLAYLLYSQQDVDTAIGMQNTRWIEVDNARDRWRNMRRQATEENGMLLLPIGTYDPHNMNNSYHKKWDLNTLQLLRIANLIQYEYQESEESNEEYLEREIEKLNDIRVCVSIQSPIPLDQDVLWEGTVELVRNSIKDKQKEVTSRLIRFLRQESCIYASFLNEYAANQNNNNIACGCCSFCREKQRTRGDVTFLPRISIDPNKIKLHSPLPNEYYYLFNKNRTYIFYPDYEVGDRDAIELMVRVILYVRRLFNIGIIELHGEDLKDEEFMENMQGDESEFIIRNKISANQFNNEIFNSGKIVWYSKEIRYDNIQTARNTEIVFLSESTADPLQKNRLLKDVVNNKRNYGDFCANIV